jgi:hypothetical protein
MPALPVFSPSIQRSTSMLFSRTATLILLQRIDVALLIGRLVDSATTARKIGQCQRRVIGTRGYFEAKGMPQIPADLLAHQAIVCQLADLGPPG